MQTFQECYLGNWFSTNCNMLLLINVYILFRFPYYCRGWGHPFFPSRFFDWSNHWFGIKKINGEPNLSACVCAGARETRGSKAGRQLRLTCRPKLGEGVASEGRRAGHIGRWESSCLVDRRPPCHAGSLFWHQSGLWSSRCFWHRPRAGFFRH